MKDVRSAIRIILIPLIIQLSLGCQKAVTVTVPPNVLTADKVYSNDASAVAATLGNYTTLGTFDANFVAYADLYVDQLSQPTQSALTTEFANGALTVTNTAAASIWQNLYAAIYRANANLEQLQESTALTAATKQQCLGEALFIRAYCHFNLINIFGDVPLITTTDVSQTAVAPRTGVGTVYKQIEADLQQAASLLSDTYPSGEKIRPNRWAAAALLAKVYLFEQDWPHAVSEASGVINSGQYTLAALPAVFLKNNNEAIWQLWNQNGFSNLSAFLTPPASGVPPYTLSSDLQNAFEAGDLRKTNWTSTITAGGKSYVAPYKYKTRTAMTGANAEYTVYLRAAEAYLIRAEANANLNSDLPAAIADINTIRKRAGLTLLSTSLTQSQVLAAVARERRIEFFGEAGNRLYDLRRTAQLNNIMLAIKPTWSSNRSSWFPIPQLQISVNSLLTQNPGY